MLTAPSSAPQSRTEELLLVLCISEALAARDTVLSRSPDALQVKFHC